VLGPEKVPRHEHRGLSGGGVGIESCQASRFPTDRSLPSASGLHFPPLRSVTHFLCSPRTTRLCSPESIQNGLRVMVRASKPTVKSATRRLDGPATAARGGRVLPFNVGISPPRPAATQAAGTQRGAARRLEVRAGRPSSKRRREKRDKAAKHLVPPRGNAHSPSSRATRISELPASAALLTSCHRRVAPDLCHRVYPGAMRHLSASATSCSCRSSCRRRGSAGTPPNRAFRPHPRCPTCATRRGSPASPRSSRD
jgi:hypothetical protein